MLNNVLRMEQCKRCGKMFIPSYEYIYKLLSEIRGKKFDYYCSYSCWRKDGGDGGKRKNC